MFLIRFFRYIVGYVVFTGSRGFPERFINLCAQKGVNIWDVKCVAGVLEAKADIKSYKKIRPCAGKSGMTLRITKKCGLPFFITPYIQRRGILAGIVISAVITALLTSTVWSVEVSGNEKFTDEQIIAVAEQYGVRPGAFKRSIDKKYIRKQIKSTVDGISWFSINIDGGRVFLEVSESKGNSLIYDKNKPCNLVSAVDGELLKLEAYEGEAAVKPGSAVMKGDLLVSGVKEKTDGSPYFVHARGTAVIRTKKSVKKEIGENIKIKKIEKIKHSPSLCIFGLKTPAIKGKSSDIMRTENKMLSFRNVTLPVGIISSDYSFLSEKNVILSKRQRASLASYYAFCEETRFMKNAETESKNIKILSQNSYVVVECDYINHEKTGIEQYFEVIK